VPHSTRPTNLFPIRIAQADHFQMSDAPVVSSAKLGVNSNPSKESLNPSRSGISSKFSLESFQRKSEEKSATKNL
jgi:hypothetical protein